MTDNSPTGTDISTARSLERDFEKSEEPENVLEQLQNVEPQPEVAPARPPAYVPPNGGYGWVCVACCFFINGHTWGINSSYGIFLANYLANNVFPVPGGP